jgi:predicted nucleic acid-binding protein
MPPAEAQKTESLLSALDCYDLIASSGRRAGALEQQWARKGRTPTLGDMIVAAIALERGCILMTDHRKDFPMEELDNFDRPESRRIKAISAGLKPCPSPTDLWDR